MGIRTHNQGNLQTERRLPSGAERFPSSMESQNKNQAPKRRLERTIPAAHKQDPSPQPGQKNTSTPVASVHRFDHWGRTPAENKNARVWQEFYRFASSKGEETIEKAITQSPYFYVEAGALVPERKNNFQKNILEENNEKRFN